jgi:hypothetical protein
MTRIPPALRRGREIRGRVAGELHIGCVERAAHRGEWNRAPRGLVTLVRAHLAGDAGVDVLEEGEPPRHVECEIFEAQGASQIGAVRIVEERQRLRVGRRPIDAEAPVNLLELVAVVLLDVVPREEVSGVDRQRAELAELAEGRLEQGDAHQPTFVDVELHRALERVEERALGIDDAAKRPAQRERPVERVGLAGECSDERVRIRVVRPRLELVAKRSKQIEQTQIDVQGLTARNEAEVATAQLGALGDERAAHQDRRIEISRRHRQPVEVDHPDQGGGLAHEAQLLGAHAAGGRCRRERLDERLRSVEVGDGFVDLDAQRRTDANAAGRIEVANPQRHVVDAERAALVRHDLPLDGGGNARGLDEGTAVAELGAARVEVEAAGRRAEGAGQLRPRLDRARHRDVTHREARVADREVRGDTGRARGWPL